MKKIAAEDFPKPTRQHQTTQIYEDPWVGVGYRPDEFCPVCKGAGFLYPREGDLVNFSQIIPCRASGCLLDSVRGVRPSETQRQTFETFRVIPGTEKALKAAKALASGEAKFIWLLIYGQPGNGKTHLCNAIVRVVRNRGIAVRMMLTADLFAQLREAIKENQTDELLKRYKNIFFLALDDYGVEYGSDWESAKFDELMTSRYATAKPTVLITNKNLTDLPERIQSRFGDKVMSRAIHNEAGDYRQLRR